MENTQKILYAPTSNAQLLFKNFSSRDVWFSEHYDLDTILQYICTYAIWIESITCWVDSTNFNFVSDLIKEVRNYSPYFKIRIYTKDRYILDKINTLNVDEIMLYKAHGLSIVQEV